MTKPKPRGRPRKSVKHTGRNIGITLIVLLFLSIGTYGLLVAVGTVDNPFEDDNGYADSGISEEDWFDSSQGAVWTEYTNPDDPTGFPIVELPSANFDIEGFGYISDFNYSNVSDFGGFQLEDTVLGDEDQIDSVRALIMIYANVDETMFDEDDLFGLIDAALELDGEFTTHLDSPLNMTVDSHGGQDVIIREGEDPLGDLYAMLAYTYWTCDVSERTYTMVYGVAKNLSYEGNVWSDTAFYAECEYVFENVQCNE